jgi:opacity protein-like surface antigen
MRTRILRKTAASLATATAVGLVCTAGAASAASIDGEGFYIAASAGKSKIKDVTKADFDGIAQSAIISTGSVPLGGSSKFEDGDTALSLIAGYRFNQFIAIEGAYLDLGSADYDGNFTFNPPGPVNLATINLGARFEVKGFTVAGVGSLPLGESFDLHARLGVFFSDSEFSITGDGDDESFSSTATDTFYGGGAAFHLGEHLSFSIDYTLFKDVGDDEDFGEIDWDAVTASVIYRL